MKIEKVDYFPSSHHRGKYVKIYEALDGLEVDEVIRVENSDLISKGFRTTLRNYSLKRGYNCSVHIEDGWIYIKKIEKKQ